MMCELGIFLMRAGSSHPLLMQEVDDFFGNLGSRVEEVEAVPWITPLLAQWFPIPQTTKRTS